MITFVLILGAHYFCASRCALSGKQSITVVDNRTGKSFELPITHDTIKASDLNKIKGDGFAGLRSYDPAYFNTASVTSRISYIDGDKGILNYRGYPIEQLAEKSTFLEVSYLLIYGELPDKKQLDYFSGRVMRHTFIHEDLATQMKAFRYDAHPMGMLISTLSSMSTVHPEANPALAGSGVYKSWGMRNKQIHRILGGVPTVAAFSYRHRIGRCVSNAAAIDISACFVLFFSTFFFFFININLFVVFIFIFIFVRTQCIRESVARKSVVLRKLSLHARPHVEPELQAAPATGARARYSVHSARRA